MSRMHATRKFRSDDSCDNRAATMHRRVPPAAALLWLLAVAGCSASAANLSPSESVEGEEGTIVCGTIPQLDSKGAVVERPEFYVTHSMNRKLRYYPDFAAEIGMQSVHDCDEARAFSQAYAKYFAAHPYFDMGLPIDPDGRLPSMPDNPAPETVEKVFNGSTTAIPFSGTPFPVVKISHAFSNIDRFYGQDGAVGNFVVPIGQSRSSTCSGTFIAKNWILTAAHCFEETVMTFPPGGQEREQWITVAQWHISWPDAFGNTTDALHPMGLEAGHIRVPAVTWVHPSFSEVSHPFDFQKFEDDNPAFAPPYDIGLLYIMEAENDFQLPPSADDSAWDIQTGHPDAPHINGWSLNDWGYGPTTNSGTNDGKLNAFLGGPPPSGVSTSSLPPDPANAGTQYTTKVVNSAVEWAFCEGDSGGPLVRQVQAGGGKVDNVIVGVNSAFRPLADAGGLSCGSPQGTPNDWAAVDVASQFIMDTINSAQIVGMRKLGSAQDAYVKLHGKSCQSDCDCGSGEVCLNPVNAPTSPALKPLAACQFCTGGASCGCIMGQCIRPDGAPTDGAAPARDCAPPSP